ncbi:hypothetical protein KC19_6G090200 [Ceratodon purpureus]|uniref:Pentatricopeptide repeat-containing protein-mitochondrial domain-containing protein n=1 Tax=Ceratodon purpureus TaxID=3225 RepID=A0A8T0HCD2_CERPU|nr:hypothetical protein KC19_6G090200 [Ceratodon purpureus]KAG0569431.1 hypothetical protein KC19_6G090200 [Ceratodon purpureus]
MASRESLKILCKQLNGRQLQREVVSRSLSSLALGGNGGGLEAGSQGIVDSGRKGFRVVRNVSSSAHCAQISSQLEVNIAASDPAPGFQAFGNPVVKGPGFSMPSGFKPVVPPALTPIEKLDEMGLAREMSNALSHQKMEETVRLYDEWVKLTDAAGNPNKPNILVYNLLLHAKLRLGAHPEVMFRIVSEMEKAGVTPTQLSFNFLLRSVFRQRDSKSAELILEKMERAGPEAQPDGDAYNFVIALCALNRRIPAALKHMQAMYERNLVPSKTTYNEVLLACARVHRTQAAVVVLKQLEAHQIVPQTQTLVELVIAATEVDDAECSLIALQHLNKSSPSNAVQPLVMDEGSIVAILGTAARSSNAALAKEAWELLKLSVGSARAPNPAAYMALVHALSSSQQFDAAFLTLAEMQSLYGTPQSAEDLEVLSPFSSLRPLVLALAQLGPAGLDGAYFKLAEMHANGQPVPLAAINCVILGCANIWDADRAYQTFESINGTFGLRPDVHSINALLDAFGKNRKTVEAVKLFEYMHESGVTPDRQSFELMIIAHVVNRDVQSASAMLAAMVSVL